LDPLFTVGVSLFVECTEKSCEAANDLYAVVTRFACRECTNDVVLSPEQWRDLLEPVVRTLDGEDDGEELTRRLERDTIYSQVESSVTKPACGACGTKLTMAAIARARDDGHVECSGCHAKVPVRPAPSELAAVLPGVTHLIGEDSGLARGVAPAPRLPGEDLTASCPACGGGLPLTGKTQAVKCTYCAAMVVVPAYVWHQIRGGRGDPHTFHLLVDRAAARASSVCASLVWDNVTGVAIGPDDGIYVAAQDAEQVGMGDPRVVFCVDRDWRTRWVRRDLELTERTRLAFARETLLVWSKEQAAARVLRASDGADAGTLGAAQPKGAKAHGLDLREAEALAVDVDGTIVFRKEDRLVRCTPQGEAVPIWPARSGFLGWKLVAKTGPFGTRAEDAPGIAAVGDYPEALGYADIGFGADGSMYVWYGRHVASFDRAGKLRWRLEVEGEIAGVGGDAKGRALVLCERGERMGVVTVDATGKAAPLGRGAKDAGRNGALLRSDGSLVAFGDWQETMAIGRDGAVVDRAARGVDDD
jgi:hypothetical protein